MSLTLLLWPSAKVCHSNPQIDDLFSRISNTDFEFSVCSLVLVISDHLFHLFLLPCLCQCQWRFFPFPLEEVSSFALSESSNIHRHRLCLLEPSTLDPAWVQRTLLLLRRGQLLLSTSGRYPIVTVGVDSVARAPHGRSASNAAILMSSANVWH